MDEFAGNAAFNSALEYCRELTIIRRELHRARVSLDWQIVFRLCESYFIALSARMRDKKKDMYETHQEMYRLAKINNQELTELMIKKSKNAPTKIFSHLIAWEIMLRQDEDRLGLLMKDAGDPSTAVMSGGF